MDVTQRRPPTQESSERVLDDFLGVASITQQAIRQPNKLRAVPVIQHRRQLITARPRLDDVIAHSQQESSAGAKVANHHPVSRPGEETPFTTRLPQHQAHRIAAPASRQVRLILDLYVSTAAYAIDANDPNGSVPTPTRRSISVGGPPRPFWPAGRRPSTIGRNPSRVRPATRYAVFVGDRAL